MTVQEATAIADAVLAYECINCGRVTDYMKEPNTAFAQFNKESIASIETAQKDAAVTLDTDIWNSFPGSVLSALSSRPDITLVINYRYEGKRYTVTIPAGSDVLSLIDENGYCGFRTLDSRFGGERTHSRIIIRPQSDNRIAVCIEKKESGLRRVRLLWDIEIQFFV